MYSFVYLIQFNQHYAITNTHRFYVYEISIPKTSDQNYVLECWISGRIKSTK